MEYTCHVETGESGNCKHTEKPEINVKALLEDYAWRARGREDCKEVKPCLFCNEDRREMKEIVDIIKQAIK